MEVVAVEVEGVVGDVIVVDHNLDCIVVVDYKRVHLAIDDRVATRVAGGGGTVEGRDLLADVGEVVEARAILSVSTFRNQGIEAGWHLPRISVLIEAKLEVKLDQRLVWVEH